jgi:hypothetical protein
MVDLSHVLAFTSFTTGALARLLRPHANQFQFAFQDVCSSFVDELDIPNVEVHVSQYLSAGYNLSISDFVSLQIRCIVSFADSYSHDHASKLKVHPPFRSSMLTHAA